MRIEIYSVMTQEEFIKVLKKEKYSYEIEGDKIVVTSKGYVYLSKLTSIPSGVVFKNGGSVNLSALTSLPPGVEFRNGLGVYFNSLTSLPPGVEFRNRGDVDLSALTSLPPGVEFRNGGDVDLRSLIGRQFNYWNGNIKRIASKRLLNVMIKQGVFI